MNNSSHRRNLKPHRHLLLLTSMALILLVGNAWAYGERSGDRPGGPPQEAIEACAGKSAGTSVEFTSPRGRTIQGTCTERDGQLVAVPEGKGQGSRGGTRSQN